MGALAVAAQAFIGVHFGVLLTDTVVVQVIVLALLSALVVVFSLVREQGRRELLQVRTVSEAAQKALLGPFPTRIGPLRFAALYLAAEDEAQIGGDLYAVAPVGHAVRIIIGDVRGKGLQAIGESGFLLGAFRQASRQSLTLDTLAAALDQSVAQYLSDLGGLVDSPEDIAEHFVTAMLLEIPDEGDLVRMTDCGHPPPLLISAGRLTPVASSDPAPPLGLGAMGAGGQPLDTFRFGPGDMILLYTDGVVEARDHQGAFYPLAERVAQWVTHTRGAAPAPAGGPARPCRRTPGRRRGRGRRAVRGCAGTPPGRPPLSGCRRLRGQGAGSSLTSATAKAQLRASSRPKSSSCRTRTPPRGVVGCRW
jgi:hypothetical protein